MSHRTGHGNARNTILVTERQREEHAQHEVVRNMARVLGPRAGERSHDDSISQIQISELIRSEKRVVIVGRVLRTTRQRRADHHRRNLGE